MPEWLRLLWGTILLRPYVFSFLLVFLIAAGHHLGWRRTLTFVPIGYFLAWFSEFSSIHWGFPYGDYYYIPQTVGRELWVAGVPFMDSLSYVFLSYCSYATALFLLSPLARCGGELFILETRKLRRSWRTLVLGAFLFMFLDIIIDPVALQGYRWFLGQIYGYREAGIYFGVPMSNFYGWFLVGLLLVGALQVLDRWSALESLGPHPLRRIPGIGLLGPVLFVSVLVFNLSVTFWIGELLLGMVGVLLVGVFLVLGLFGSLHKLEYVTPAVVDHHLTSFPQSRAALRLSPARAGGADPGTMPTDPVPATLAKPSEFEPDGGQLSGNSAKGHGRKPPGPVS
ncbi:MAG TPA: carotenoid biosynthesis protein [Syntrophobacteraceae bacterium]|nr:carotenoid biosynthesis protein [Syntrophobacteraceae bacterium]